MSATVALSVLKDLPWKAIIKVSTVFTLFFSTLMTYFNMSVLTSAWTSLLVSSIFSLGMTAGILCSLHIRIAAAVAVVQMFSQFGLLMLFTFTSWISIQDTLENVVQVQTDLQSHSCTTSPANETSDVITDFKRLASTIVFLHYSNAAPFFLIFVYSVFYELTYEVRKEKEASNESSTSNFLSTLLMLGRHLMSFLVGVIFAFTLALFVFQIFYFHSVLSATPSIECKQLVRDRQTEVCFTLYLIFCGVFIVLLPFSRLIPMLRSSIVRRFIAADQNSAPRASKSKKQVTERSAPKASKSNPQNIENSSSIERASTLQQQDDEISAPRASTSQHQNDEKSVPKASTSQQQNTQIPPQPIPRKLTTNAHVSASSNQSNDTVIAIEGDLDFDF